MCDTNLKPALMLVSAGRQPKDYFMSIIIGQQNHLTLDSVNGFPNILRRKLNNCVIPSHVICWPHNSLNLCRLNLCIRALFDTIPHVTPTEVSKLLTSMPSKSSNLDYVPTSLLKSSHLVFSQLIAKLATLSFQEGCFPQSFKTTLVTPLIKKSNLEPENLSNHRPISNLNNISKLLGKLFLSRLQPHVLASPNVNPYQSAYRRNHSTETALLCTLDHVFHSATAHKSTILVSLDFSAAFDTIDPSILLNSLISTFGISGTALRWITSYLTKRSQFVKIGNSSSNLRSSISGVPQGSVLGPLLFTIYVSPIASLISQQGVNQHQYADDTQLFISISQSSASADIQILKSALVVLSQWFSHNCLALNPDKSEAIFLGTQQRNSSLSNRIHINVAGSTVPLSDTIKLLSVTLDKSLTVHKHFNQVSQSCYYHLKAFRHIRPCLDNHTASLIAHALMSSRLEYANSVLFGAALYVTLKL
jgi:Reverse transcriptase (RNA-dependent DNA polymerase)